MCGLSPRVRGNPARVIASRVSDLSIPACAGEPEYRREGLVPCAVYPRVCGGTASRAHPVHATTGLSPRVRGNPLSFSVPYAIVNIQSRPTRGW